MRVKDESKQLAIVENTIEVVFERGFAGIKMADLAKRVGLSVSTLYVYYKNKEDLIVSIATDLIARETQRSEQGISGDLPYKKKLKTLWLFWINFSINHRKEMSFLEQLKKSPYYDKVPVAVKENKSKLAMELIDLGKKEGLLKNIDNNIHFAVIGAIMGETVKLIMDKKLELHQKDMDLMFSTVWDAIKS
ncbi:TetR/AcrR family transcriptional regulator [Arenibacter sp. M-2]|uniref:TetR/AcrR family transcriptional regulator n=1 Tax=unclassified Arenibacter TaxID=2615047 RepID=UPI000D76BA1A|nr:MULTISPECIES: TetR/AcrR family transcriptional regulator [unclassified Arenibacter]MDL5514259.1 TetR/AcrR family transcriptional regulator [Arenibacter sp. M-2]PXX29664.1 TetR family transcriptional regulator [Arenibacter sp. ARW7G5Y1]